MTSDMQLMENSGTSEGWKCPSCGAQMPDGAVICIECGYDKRTGRRINEPVPKSWTRYTVVSTLVAVVLILAVRFYFKSMKPAPIPRPVAASVPAPAPKPIVTNAVAPTPSNATQVAVATNAAATNATPVAPKIDTNELARIEREARAKERREQFERQLDEKYPMFAPGEQVALRSTNAIVRRGVFKRIRELSVVLETGTNQTTLVPFESLDKFSRLRCDTDFRHDYEEYWLSKTNAPGR